MKPIPQRLSDNAVEIFILAGLGAVIGLLTDGVSNIAKRMAIGAALGAAGGIANALMDKSP